MWDISWPMLNQDRDRFHAEQVRLFEKSRKALENARSLRKSSNDLSLTSSLLRDDQTKLYKMAHKNASITAEVALELQR